MHAEDPDVGENARVSYDFANPNQVQDLYSIDRQTGQIFTKKLLTGKGRNEPYIITIRHSLILNYTDKIFVEKVYNV